MDKLKFRRRLSTFSSVIDSNALIISCLPAWGSLQLWKAKGKEKSLLISKLPVEHGLELLPSGALQHQMLPSDHRAEQSPHPAGCSCLHSLPNHPPSACWAPGGDSSPCSVPQVSGSTESLSLARLSLCDNRASAATVPGFTCTDF